MMCCGLSGFLLMGVSGLTAESAVSGSDADGEEMAGWFRIGCMVLGYPLRSTQQLSLSGAFSIPGGVPATLKPVNPFAS